jgi:hypothetical protein
VAGHISPEMIDAVQRHIFDALARTLAGGTLPEDEQDRMLAQAAAEACAVLSRWQDSFEWDNVRPSGSAPIADAIPDWKRIRPFLGPLKEGLTAIVERRSRMPGAPKMRDPADYIDRAIKAARRTAGRHPRLGRDQLFEQAVGAINELRDEVCQLSDDLKVDLDSRAKQARRKRARSILAKVAGVLLTLSLAMAGASPHNMRQNIPEWGHEAVRVLMVHIIAETAQPSVRLTPPRLRPQPR